MDHQVPHEHEPLSVGRRRPREESSQCSRTWWSTGSHRASLLRRVGHRGLGATCWLCQLASCSTTAGFRTSVHARFGRDLALSGAPVPSTLFLPCPHPGHSFERDGGRSDVSRAWNYQLHLSRRRGRARPVGSVLWSLRSAVAEPGMETNSPSLPAAVRKELSRRFYPQHVLRWLVLSGHPGYARRDRANVGRRHETTLGALVDVSRWGLGGSLVLNHQALLFCSG